MKNRNNKIKNTMKNFSDRSRNFLFMTLLFIAGLFALTRLTEFAKGVKNLSYDEFIHEVSRQGVKSVSIDGQQVAGVLKEGNTHFETVIVDSPENTKLLLEKGVKIDVTPPGNPATVWYFILFGFSILGGLGLWFVLRQVRNAGSGGPGNIFNMGKSKAKMFMPMQVKVNFESVAGVHEAKEELQDVVDFLKNPKKFSDVGARLTRGVLLVGEPGNGKTMLAKAVAGEANCPFFSVSGSDFMEMFVGVGASRVRDLFAQARKHSPSIIFIDEIDAIGRKRSNGTGGAHEEREQTLNQLLAEMDGFNTAGTSVVVMAATNRADILDKALLRPGRFDRQVYVPYPDLQSRKEILKVHIKNVKVDDSVNIDKIARGTTGFTGADLANLINEAAIYASKQNKKIISGHDFEEARDKIILGKERKTVIMSEHERNVTAYHEAGHTLASVMMPKEDTHPLHKVTIVPRERSLGLTCWIPERDTYLKSKNEILASIVTSLGGRVAEELVFGQASTGAYNDFQHSTKDARHMVRYYGMTEEVGPIVFDENNDRYSEETAKKIDHAVREIIDSCYTKAKTILVENRDKLDILAKALLEKETIDGQEVYELLGIDPRENSHLV